MDKHPVRKHGDNDSINFFKGLIFALAFSFIMYGIITFLIILL